MDAPESAASIPARNLTSEQVQDRDWLHLKLLVIFHYVVGGAVIARAVESLIELANLLAMASSVSHLHHGHGAFGSPPLFFNVLTRVVSLLGLVAGPLSIAVGRRLRDRRSYYFCRAWSVWQWFLAFPLGIPLGICLRNVLRRDSIRGQFQD